MGQLFYPSKKLLESLYRFLTYLIKEEIVYLDFKVLEFQIKMFPNQEGSIFILSHYCSRYILLKIMPDDIQKICFSVLYFYFSNLHFTFKVYKFNKVIWYKNKKMQRLNFGVLKKELGVFCFILG